MLRAILISSILTAICTGCATSTLVDDVDKATQASDPNEPVIHVVHLLN